MTVGRLLRRIPLMGPLALFFYRAWVGAGFVLRPWAPYLRWLFTSRETTNYTYALTPANRLYLAAFLANCLQVPLASVLAYIEELETDSELQQHIFAQVRASKERDKTDLPMHYGRRLAWYVLVRVLHPAVVVETGVEKGLGCLVVAAALLRNAPEGHPGHHYGTDINPRAGYLLAGKYATVAQVLYGDSLQTLRAFTHPIDLFINDSDHSASYEAAEYELVAPKLSPGAVVVGDNAHATLALWDFARHTGRRFAFFKEESAGHPYSGAGMGLAWQ